MEEIPMTVSRRLAFGAAALPLALGAAREARAQAPSGSALDAAIKRGTLIVGTSLSSPPFGIVDANLQPDGYDAGIARLLARELGVKLEIQDIVASNRIPSLTSGKVDIVISSFSITAERAKAIAFTNCVYVDQQVALGPKSVVLSGIEDMKGKTIGVTRSTTNDIAVTRRAPEGTLIQRYDDDAATNQAIFAGQVQAMVTSAGGAFAIRQHNPTLEIKFVVSEAPMGIGVRHGDPDLLHWLNTALFMLWTNKEIQPLQQKWMGAVNTDLPRYS
jgi:polar amino acid transport system substrate-binding protein